MKFCISVKKTVCIIISMLCVLYVTGAAGIAAFADEDDLLSDTDARAALVTELESGSVICAHGENEKLSMGHMAKLMTLLICAERLRSGELSLSDEVSVSDCVSDLPSPMIWLEKGELITVEELVKAIAMGNSNDACAVLAEKLSESGEAHIEMLNARAAALGMVNTHFADVCGLDERTVSTAADIALMMKALSKHDELTGYFTAWIDNVRDGRTELVNTDRLVRSCKGITTGKFCSEKGGHSLVLTAERSGMNFCIVLLGSADKDGTFAAARDILDTCAEGYRLYKPETEKELLAPVPVTNGTKHEVRVKESAFEGVLLPRGASARTEFTASIPESVEAPVAKGRRLGSIVYTLDGEQIAEVTLEAAEDVGRMDWGFGIYRCLCNMFKM